MKALASTLLSWAPALAATFGIAVLGMAIVVLVNSSGFGYDYRAYDAAARRIVGGEPLYLPGSVDAYREGRYEGLYLYPPPVAVLFLPLTLLSETAAATGWMVIRLGLLVGGCAALPVTWRARFGTLGVAGISFPVLFDLNIGNVSIVVFALCAVAWRWMDRPIAAVVHAVLAALRFPFGIFGLLWIVQRRFRMLGWTLVGGVVLILLAVPIVGFVAYGEYIAILRGLPDISAGPHNFSFKSVALNAGLPGVLVALALPMSYLLGLGAVVFAGLRRVRSTAFVVTTTATLLVAPFIHTHYLVLLLLPAALLMHRGRWWGLVLPLLGWLPEGFQPFAGLLAIVLVLTVEDDPSGEADVRASLPVGAG